MIKGEIIGGESLVARLDAVGPKIQTKIETTIQRLVLTLMANVQRDKLSGQVLNVRTGRLRRSITQRMQGLGTTSVSGIVGTNVEYARAHEMGFQGTVTVKAHLRMMTKAFGKPVKDPHQIQVNSHSRNMNIPEKSFLRSALNDMRPEIKEKLKAAIGEAVKP